MLHRVAASSISAGTCGNAAIGRAFRGLCPRTPRRRFGEQGKGTKLVSPRGEPGGSQTARPTSRAPDGVATRWPPATLAADRAARLADAHAARRDQPDPEWRGVARERGA